MESIIFKTVKADYMKQVFETKSDICYIKFFDALVSDKSKITPEQEYKYKILIRHANNECPKLLFLQALYSLPDYQFKIKVKGGKENVW